MSLRCFILICLFGGQAFAATEVTLAFIRYQPEKKAQLLAPVRVNVPPAKLRAQKSEAVLTELRKQGAATLVFQTTETLLDDKPKQIEKSETASVILPGENVEFPKITKLAVKFHVQAAPFQDNHQLSWNGAIHWSPEILDHSAKTTQSKTNITLLRPFAPDGNTSGFEYPILKQTTFQSSKLAKDGELIVTVTTAESGARPPEILLLCIWAFPK